MCVSAAAAGAAGEVTALCLRLAASGPNHRPVNHTAGAEPVGDATLHSMTSPEHVTSQLNWIFNSVGHVTLKK